MSAALEQTYLVDVEMMVTASSVQEAIKVFLADVRDNEVNFLVTDENGVSVFAQQQRNSAV